MIWKAVVLLGATLSASCHELEHSHHGVAFSEQHIVRHYQQEYPHNSELRHIGEHKPQHREEYARSYPSYEFSYKVADPHTRDFKGQHEVRLGDLVKGEYWLVEPDGNKRTVKYHADDKTGFLAEVHNSKHHVHLKTPHHEKKSENPEKPYVPVHYVKPVEEHKAHIMPQQEPKHKHINKVHIESYIRHQPIKHEPISHDLHYSVKHEEEKKEVNKYREEEKKEEHHEYREEEEQAEYKREEKEEHKKSKQQREEHKTSEEQIRHKPKSHHEQRIHHEYKNHHEERHEPKIHYDEHISYEPKRHEEHIEYGRRIPVERPRHEPKKYEEENYEQREHKKHQEEREHHSHRIYHEEHNEHKEEEKIPEEYYRHMPLVHHQPRHRVEYEHHHQENKKAAEEAQKRQEQRKHYEGPKIQSYKPRIEDEESYGWLPKHLEHRPRYNRDNTMQRPIVVEELN